jgi:hypothetical protein
MVLLEVIQVLFVYSSFIMFVHAEYTLDSLIFLNFSTSTRKTGAALPLHDM